MLQPNDATTKRCYSAMKGGAIGAHDLPRKPRSASTPGAEHIWLLVWAVLQRHLGGGATYIIVGESWLVAY